MTKQELKIKLLNTNLFIDNSYLQDYLNLVDNYKITEIYIEKHHILPRCWYKYNKQPLDNSEDNIINLAYKDHCKAHWLLYFCTKGYLQQANEAAVRYISEMYKKLTGNEKHKFDFVQADFDLLQTYMNDIINDTNSRYWSELDIQFLKNNYTGYGSGPYCAKQLNKSLSQVTDKAKHLGLAQTCPNWTTEELDILYKYYPMDGDKVYLRIPLHSKAACRAKAKQLNIKSLYHYWSEQEISILIINFPLVGPSGCSKLLQNRNKNECKHKADRLGLVYVNNPQKVWTEEKIQILLENKDKGIKELENILKLSRGCIYKKLKELLNGENNDRREN